MQYAQQLGVVDIDGDKTSEVLLEASSYSMGQLVMGIDAVKLAATARQASSSG